MPNSANHRIPTRPLSYSKRHLATPKELLIDWVEGELWICNEKGEFVNITASEQEVIEETIKLIKSDPTILSDVSVELPDGSKVLVSEAIVRIIRNNEVISEEIDRLSDSVNILSDDLKKKEDLYGTNFQTITNHLRVINENIAQLSEVDESLDERISTTNSVITKLDERLTTAETTLTETAKVAKGNKSSIDSITKSLSDFLKSDQIVISTTPFESNKNIPDTAILYIEVEE